VIKWTGRLVAATRSAEVKDKRQGGGGYEKWACISRETEYQTFLVERIGKFNSFSLQRIDLFIHLFGRTFLRTELTANLLVFFSFFNSQNTKYCGVIAPCGSSWNSEISKHDCAKVVSDVFPYPRCAPHHALIGYAVNTGPRNSKEGSRDLRDVTRNNTQRCVLLHVRLQRL
jgi:hypothetical protein